MLDPTGRPTILCISSYEKGQAFIREAAHLGANVILLTQQKFEHGDWPLESLSQLIAIPEMTEAPVLNEVCRIGRGTRIDRVVALDEFDTEIAALVREHLRLPGMGLSLMRNFRDKLAMRTQARKAAIPVPDFTGVFHYDDLRAFMSSVPAPWLLKPRMSAGAIGIRRIEESERLWRTLDELGDEQSHYILERFVPGEVFHVDGITWNGEVLFAAPHRYGQPPMQTMHQGGVFTTRSLRPDSADAHALRDINDNVMHGLGMVSGVTHTEFIKAAEDGSFYFLETAARVGGAYIADVVEASTGINPWVEWARIEAASLFGKPYALPQQKHGHAGSVICLARQEDPDTSAYDASEIVIRLSKSHHAGLVIASKSADRVDSLVDRYAQRFLDEFCAVVAPPTDRPTA